MKSMSQQFTPYVEVTGEGDLIVFVDPLRVANSLLAASACRAVLIGQRLRSDVEFRHRGFEVIVFEFFRRHTRVFLDLFRLTFAHFVSPEGDHATHECNTAPRDSPPPTTRSPSDSHPPEHVPSLASARPRHS